MDNVIVWILIAIGVLVGVASVVELRRAAAKPGVITLADRKHIWLGFTVCTVIIASGLRILGEDMKNAVIEWLPWSIAVVLQVLAFFSWLRSRKREKGSGDVASS